MTPRERGDAIAIRGALITFDGDPLLGGMGMRRYERDAIVVMANGRIVDCGATADVASRLAPDTPVTHYDRGLISAGFIDAHVHYPQLPVIGASGKALLEWLTDYTFPAEARFGDIDYARPIAALSRRERAQWHHDGCGVLHRACSVRRRFARGG